VRARDVQLLQDRTCGGAILLGDVIIFLIVSGLIGSLVCVMASPNRYARMSDQEFEEDTQKSSVLGAVVIGMERALRRREADFAIEQKLRVEKDATTSGDHRPKEKPRKEKPPR
jgi:hypothetical protein